MPDNATTLPSLIASGDPPPCEIVNPSGAAPVVLACDHASHAVPRALHNLGLDAADLQRHVAWDIGAAEVTRRLARLLDASAVLAGYSRLLIDCNRQLDDPTSIPVISDSLIVPGNRNVDPAQARQRAQDFFHPYHAALRRQIHAVKARSAGPALIFIHSFTPVYKRIERPWHMGVLWKSDARIPLPLLRSLRARGDISVGDNQPYSGHDGHDYTIEAHAASAGLAHALIEIRQDLIASEDGADTWADILFQALRPILSDPELHTSP